MKSSPYLLYLLNYNEQQKSNRELDDLEEYLRGMLFPHWEFLVSAENEYALSILLFPRSERDLFLLNTDLRVLLIDLIEQFWANNVENGGEIFGDCRSTLDEILDKIQSESKTSEREKGSSSS